MSSCLHWCHFHCKVMAALLKFDGFQPHKQQSRNISIGVHLDGDGKKNKHCIQYFSLSIGDILHGPKLLTCTSTAHPPAGSLRKNDKKNCWRQNERPSTCLLNLLILIRGYLLTKSLKPHKLFSWLSNSWDPHVIFSQSSDFPANKHQKKMKLHP